MVHSGWVYSLMVFTTYRVGVSLPCANILCVNRKMKLISNGENSATKKWNIDKFFIFSDLPPPLSRLCGYDSNYLKNSVQKSHGSQKLLHWSVHDVIQWVRSIELEDYVSGLNGTGIHGALMVSVCVGGQSYWNSVCVSVCKCMCLYKW